MTATVVVDGYSERWLRKGFPWVYPKEVQKGKLHSGEEVIVRSGKGEFLGSGIADEGWLAVRVFRHDEGLIDHTWIYSLLDRAAVWRKQRFSNGQTTGFRLVHAENDGLPGVRIDQWGHYAVITLDSPALAKLVPICVDWFQQHDPRLGIYVCYRSDPRDTLDTSKAQSGLVAGVASTQPMVVYENGVPFEVMPHDGPDVGLYADMRDVRTFLTDWWKDRRVLNTFAYTGAFSVAAARGGAAEIISVDLSERYLERAKRNFAINDLPVIPNHFVAEDTFKALDRFRRKGEKFDAIVLDPPSFSHGPSGMWSTMKDYPRLVAAAARVLSPGGWLLAACNLGELSPHKFHGEIEDGLRKADVVGQEVWRGNQAVDFPAASWFPEGRYLKANLWRVW